MEEDRITPAVAPTRGSLPPAVEPYSEQATRASNKYRTPTFNRRHPLRSLPNGPRELDALHAEEVRREKELAEVLHVSSRLGVVCVPSNMVCLVERLNRYNRLLTPGVRMIIPGVERVAHALYTAMQHISFIAENVFTDDGIRVEISGAIFYKVSYRTFTHARSANRVQHARPAFATLTDSRRAHCMHDNHRFPTQSRPRTKSTDRRQRPSAARKQPSTASSPNCPPTLSSKT